MKTTRVLLSLAAATLLLMTGCGGGEVTTPGPGTVAAEAPSAPATTPTQTPAPEPAASAAPGDRIYCTQHEIVAHTSDAFQGERVDAYDLYSAMGDWLDDLGEVYDMAADESLRTYAVDLEARLLALRAVLLRDGDVPQRVFDVYTASEKVALRYGALTGEDHRAIWANS
ncbi:MAG TPA: hypothetical protein GXZ60_16150 [Intrasporangiaceae bacterium]|nr:hypothetical protein [Intrasporangiaceae bacterium]